MGSRTKEGRDPGGRSMRPGLPEAGQRPLAGWPTADRTWSTLQALHLATLVLDAAGAVLQSNPAAAAWLASLPQACWCFGQLRMLGPRCSPSLPEAIAACRRDAPVQITTMLCAPEGRLAHATLLALPPQPAGEPQYLLLVELPRADGLQTARSVAALFGLTPAEVRVLGGLLDGAAPAAIARAAGSALATVRTHISNILAKTETAGQAELLVRMRGLR